MQLQKAKNSLASFFICAKKKKKNTLACLTLQLKRKEKGKKNAHLSFLFYFILFIILFIFIFIFFGPLKALPPPPHPFKSELLAPGFLKMLVRLDCV